MIADIILSPTRAYSDAEGIAGWKRYLPFALLIFSSIALIVYYFTSVDTEWLKERLLARIPADKQAIAATMLSFRFLITSALIAQLFKFTAWMTGLSAYYMFIDKLHAGTRDLGSWFYFTSLSYVPLLLLLPLGVMATMIAPQGLMLDQLDTTSINSLAPGLCRADWASACNRISALQTWPVILQAIGLSLWIRISLSRSIIIAVLPTLLCYVAVVALASNTG